MTEITRPALRLIRGDCLDVLRTLPDNSVDSVVTDPPYGIRFMGKAWDGADIEARAAARKAMASHDPSGGPNGGHKSVAAEAGKYDLAPAAMRAFQDFSEAWAREALRVLKPGGHLLSFASPRTYHRMAAGIEDAGFEIRDQIMWVFGSGFPKSHNGEWGGTALKPAHEPIVVARKPLIGTVAKNWAAHGVGGLNIDGCRVPSGGDDTARWSNGAIVGGRYGSGGSARGPIAGGHELGRWPANLIHDGSDEVQASFPQAPGQQGPISTSADQRKTQNVYGAMRRGRSDEASADRRYGAGGSDGFAMLPGFRRLDEGSAARFFYCAKASRADRNDGIGGSDDPAVTTDATPRDCEAADWAARNGNHHPTVKPTELMRYLVRLVTPPGGTVLDCFMGSGSTGRAAVLEGLGFIGIEKDEDDDGTPLGYFPIAEARVAAAERQRDEEAAQQAVDDAQRDLFEEQAA